MTEMPASRFGISAPALRWKVVLEPLILLVALGISSYAIVLNASVGRPIWIDEFLHFAFAAFPTTSDAWEAIRRSIGAVNHNQTGAYMIIDYWLLSIFGASVQLLRSPSIFSGCVMFLSTIYIFRVLKLSAIWSLIAVLAACAQTGVMFYIGEARPYMPLIAATTTALGYFLVPFPERSRIPYKVTGYFSAVYGALMHPYFLVYWPLVATVGYIHQISQNSNTNISVRGFIKHCSPQITVTGFVISFILGRLTWMAGMPAFDFDPFQFVTREALFPTFISFHFGILGSHPLRTIAVLLVASIVCAYFSPETRLAIAAPFCLVLASVILSVVLGAASYFKGYWILPRQWVASSILVSIGLVWLLAVIASLLSKRFPPITAILAILAFWVMWHPISDAHATQLKTFQTYISSPATKCGPELIEMPYVTGQAGSDLWTDTARSNIACGGPVWPIFARYYGAVFAAQK